MMNATLEYLAVQAYAHRDRVAARYGPASAQLRAAERAVVEIDRETSVIVTVCQLPSARMGRMLAAAIVAAVAMMFCVAPAAADVPGIVDPPGCTTDTIFGLQPHWRTICDEPIQPGGWWARARRLWHKEYVHSSCDGVYYQGGNCPPWLERDVIPAEEGPIETYIVTADTIPPGEPGHLG